MGIFHFRNVTACSFKARVITTCTDVRLLVEMNVASDDGMQADNGGDAVATSSPSMAGRRRYSRAANGETPSLYRTQAANGEDAVATNAVVTSIDVRLRVFLRVFFEAVVPRIADGQRLAALDDRFRRINAWNRHAQAVAQ